MNRHLDKPNTSTHTHTHFQVRIHIARNVCSAPPRRQTIDKAIQKLLHPPVEAQLIQQKWFTKLNSAKYLKPRLCSFDKKVFFPANQPSICTTTLLHFALALMLLLCTQQRRVCLAQPQLCKSLQLFHNNEIVAALPDFQFKMRTHTVASNSHANANRLQRHKQAHVCT